jgi:ribonuclease HII
LIPVDLMKEERHWYARGLTHLAGVDEVGRGCLAGPVYAAAVILPPNFDLPHLNDSKKLKSVQREVLSVQIQRQAIAWRVAKVEVEEIDRINIFRASLRAIALALEGLSVRPERVLVDGNFPAPVDLPQTTLVKGDQRSASIAAASIIAKVARDRFMAGLEKIYPKFSFGRHKGYGTAKHLEELKTHGPTPLHRRSFAPVHDQWGLFSQFES